MAGTSISTQYDIKETLISKIRTSISLYLDIKDLSISTNGPLRIVNDIEALCFDIVFFDIGVSLPDPAWATVAPTRYLRQIAVCTLHC